MGKIFRTKFFKQGDMIYISHLDVQRLFHRAFRRAGIDLSYSQGYNPHPKMSYGNALSLGIESQGEYVDIEVDDDVSAQDLVDKVNNKLPDGIQFIKAVEIGEGEKSLSSMIEYGEYIFFLDLDAPLTKGFVKNALFDFLSKEEIIVEKKNKKGVVTETNIRPLIRNFDMIDLNEDRLVLTATIATGSKRNLNTNIFVPIILDVFGIKQHPLDVHIIRRDLYFEVDGKLETPMSKFK